MRRSRICVCRKQGYLHFFNTLIHLVGLPNFLVKTESPLKITTNLLLTITSTDEIIHENKIGFSNLKKIDVFVRDRLLSRKHDSLSVSLVPPSGHRLAYRKDRLLSLRQIFKMCRPRLTTFHLLNDTNHLVLRWEFKISLPQVLVTAV